MCHPVLLARQIAPVRRKCMYENAISQTFRNLAVFVILLALLSKTASKDISSLEKIVGRVKNINTRSENLISNEIDLDYEEDDDEEFQVGYSAYLYKPLSMLTTNNKNYTDNRIFSGNNNATFESSEVAAKGHQRSKRGVTHLYNMIVCATGCNPLSYKGYGCYCGFLGSGYPMDGIDRCCKIHDWCYDSTDCPMFVEYFVPYYWKCYHGFKPLCAIEHGEWGSSGSCAQRLCECDRSFAECLRRYRCPRHKAVCTSSPWRLIQNIFMII